MIFAKKKKKGKWNRLVSPKRESHMDGLLVYDWDSAPEEVEGIFFLKDNEIIKKHGENAS